MKNTLLTSAFSTTIAIVLSWFLVIGAIALNGMSLERAYHAQTLTETTAKQSITQARHDLFQLANFLEQPIYDLRGKIEALDISFSISSKRPQKVLVSIRLYPESPRLAQTPFKDPPNVSVALLNSPQQVRFLFEVRRDLVESEWSTIRDGPLLANIFIVPTSGGDSIFFAGGDIVGQENGWNRSTKSPVYIDGHLRTHSYRVSDFR